GAADLNTLPSAMVDHIEILKDGASSIYGSDAVAGVINIVTERELDHFTLEGQHNFTEQGGGNQTRLSITGGHVFDGGRLRVSGAVEYYERDAITRGDRDWASCNTRLFSPPQAPDYIDPRTGTLRCYTTGLTGENGVTINTIGTGTTAGVGATGTVGTTFNRWRPNSAVLTGIVGYEGVGGGSTTSLDIRDTFEPRMLNVDLVSGGENWNAYLQGSYDLHALGDAEIYAEALYSRRQSVQVGYRQLSLDYPDNSPLLPSQLWTTPNFSNATTYPNPAPTNVTLPPAYATGVRAFIGFGNYDTSQDVTFNRYLAGIRGDFLLPDWRYDFSVTYGRNEGEYTFESWLTDRLFHSLNVVTAPVGTPTNLVRNVNGTNYMCAVTATNPAYGCIPAPFLSNQVVAGTDFPQNWVDWTFVPVVGLSVYEELTLAGAIDGPVIDLPAGQVMAAFGIEYRDAEINDTPDFNSVNNNLYNLTASTPTRGTDTVTEVFGEVEVPLLAGQPLADALSLNVSARYTDYDSYGADWTHKVGLLYRPFEGLSFRGTQGTSYRAPALFEQFLGSTTGFLAATQDPCNNYGGLPVTSQRYINCNAEIGNTSFVQTQGVTVVSAGGAAQGLEAETSDNYTIGFVVSPTDWIGEQFGRLELAVDYFSIHVENQVTRVGFANLRSLCYDSTSFPTDPYCSYFQRNPSTLALRAFDNYTNISNQEAFGIDYSARYQQDLFGGTATVNLNLTQYKEQSFQVLPTSASSDSNGWIGSPEWVGDVAVNFETGPWVLRWGTTWVAAQSDAARRGNPAGVDLDTPDYYLHNVSVQYTQEDGDWRLTAGVRNLEDVEPPTISAGFNNRVGNSPIYSGYDYFGRQFFVNLSTNF
ncbi:MAG: TonB-dependent receptor, partial [Hyphomonadaceae bacterium]|nr:TonB-dependent receptor [Hyphomonadaceae bacterium]